MKNHRHRYQLHTLASHQHTVCLWISERVFIVLHFYEAKLVGNYNFL